MTPKTYLTMFVISISFYLDSLKPGFSSKLKIKLKQFIISVDVAS